MTKGFASSNDMVEKKVTFSEIGPDLYAFTAEGDPNSAVIVGDDGCIEHLVAVGEPHPALGSSGQRVGGVGQHGWLRAEHGQPPEDLDSFQSA